MSELHPNRVEDAKIVVHRIEISYKTILAVALTVVAIWLLGILMPILIVLVTALILVGTLSPLVVWLHPNAVALAAFAAATDVIPFVGGLLEARIQPRPRSPE